MSTVKPLKMIKKGLAEREGFEPPVRFPVHLISSFPDSDT
jgi:hypothetical protein